MNKIRYFISGFCLIIAVIGIVFSVWKIARCWRSGFAEKTGRTIDASVSAAAKSLEKTAVAIELRADNGLGESLGKGLDDVLTDTRKKLDKTASLVQHHAK